MVFFGKVILLSIGILLTVSLVMCFGGDNTTSSYDCASGNVCSCQDKSCITVECRNIDTEEEVVCSQQYLQELRAIVSFTELKFHNCTLESIPVDFLKSHPLERLYFFDSVGTKIPWDLMAPICDTLQWLELRFRNPLTTIEEKAFGECPSLTRLSLKMNHIKIVSPKAFLGLSNLESLDLGDNDITFIEGLEGTPRLKTLILRYNSLRYVAKNAFQNSTSLEYIYLGKNQLTSLKKGTFKSLTSLNHVNLMENPLICDCKLKWLQDWLKTHDEYSRTECGAGRRKYPLKDMDLSYCPAEMEDGQSSRNSATDVTVILSLLILAMKYLEVI